MASMENLIALINKLQDAFTNVGVQNPIDLPQIVVIGSQSSGKSSVLENIVGRDFLPRGSGIVTRRPLVLQLINVAKGTKPPHSTTGNSRDYTVEDPKIEKERGPEEKEGILEHGIERIAFKETFEEWGEFLHIPSRSYTDFEEIRKEIIRDTDSKTGHSKGVSAIPIHLKVYSPFVLNLTLVDLPGMTKVPVGDQPKDIEKQIREMVIKFIEKPNSIILAVTAANTDLANSDGLKLAREVDPEGLRTIGVLTKIDLMDSGTDVLDILAGKIVPLRLGYVPVVNRGQKDVSSSTSIAKALQNERFYFENHPAYKNKAQYCGTPFLAKKLNFLLMHHIRECMPEIKSRISSMLGKYESELLDLGEPIEETQEARGNLILNIITEFCRDFRTIIDGSTENLTSSELSGGARISFVFHELFANGIHSMDPFDQIADGDIRTILYNASVRHEVLVKQQIKRLEDPSLQCINLIYEELIRILNQTEQKNMFKKYPMIRGKFHSAAIAFFKKLLEPTSKFVSDIIRAESCYVNTAHPDFLNGHKAMALVQERSNLAQRGLDKDKSRLGSTTPVLAKSQDDGVFSGFFKSRKQSTKNELRLEPPPAVLKAAGTLSEREQIEMEVIKMLLVSYFDIVKRTVADMVPKAIMLYLVFNAKENIQRELLNALYKSEEVMELLKESDQVTQRRLECQRMVLALQRAEDIVSSV